MPTTKKHLRKVFLEKRKTISDHEYEQRNAMLLRQFMGFMKERKVEYLHIFLPIVAQKEVNTWLMIEALQHSGMKIVLSKSELNDSTLTHYLYENKDQLASNKWGIPEPAYGEIIRETSIDMVMIPLVVFDRQGQRIGYGKGYYDRFLAGCREDCVKVGLSLSPPLDRIVCSESHDIAMNYCLTPFEIYSFEK